MSSTTKERFLSVFKMHAIRTRGCTPASAESYVSYLNGANTHAMSELGYPDYLEWLAECSSSYSAKRYIERLEESVFLTTVPDGTKSKHRTAIAALGQFADEIFSSRSNWRQFGSDKETTALKYKKDTSAYITGLCVDLNNEYIRVVDFAKYIFGDLFDDKVYDFIPVTLSPEKLFRKYPVTPEYLNKLSEKREEREDTTEEENEILRSKAINCPVWARFNSGAMPNIEIFYLNVSQSSREDYLSALKNCLAHEYMHYLHACYCSKIGDTSTFDNSEICEGVAEFFAMLFSLYRDGASDWRFTASRYLSWAKLQGSGWHYASALCMYKAAGKENFYTERVWDFKDNGCIEKLVDVLKKSTRFADAYKLFKG